MTTLIVIIIIRKKAPHNYIRKYLAVLIQQNTLKQKLEGHSLYWPCYRGMAVDGMARHSSYMATLHRV